MDNTTSYANPRVLALDTLMGIGKGRYGNIAVDTVLRRSHLSDPDRHLFTALVYGVLERKTTLDYLIGRFSARPTTDLDEKVIWALRLGFYQLIYMDRIPDHAAVGETVALLPRKTSGFVNAVLRSYLRFEASLGKNIPRENTLLTPEQWVSRFPDLGKPTATYPPECVAYGVPPSMWEIFKAALGQDTAEAVLSALREKPATTLRCNTLRTSPEALMQAIRHKTGIQVDKGLYLDHALRLSEGAVTSLTGFEDGHFFVQDEASQLCVQALNAQPHDTVIDTCACPGSKSFGVAISMENTGKLYAFDLHQSKLSLIETGAERLGISIIETAERDARHPHPDLIGKADRVLCDVPCSGLGVIAKKPEIRHKDMTESSRLPSIQADILEASSAYVKNGGVLVYSTCTILPEENQNIVSSFLAKHPDFEPYDFEFSPLDGGASPIVSEGGMITLLPHLHHTDGFFIARMRRK